MAGGHPGSWVSLLCGQCGGLGLLCPFCHLLAANFLAIFCFLATLPASLQALKDIKPGCPQRKPPQQSRAEAPAFKKVPHCSPPQTLLPGRKVSEALARAVCLAIRAPSTGRPERDPQGASLSGSFCRREGSQGQGRNGRETKALPGIIKRFPSTLPHTVPGPSLSTETLPLPHSLPCQALRLHLCLECAAAAGEREASGHA